MYVAGLFNEGAQVFGESRDGLYILEPNSTNFKDRSEDFVVSSSKQNVFNHVPASFPFTASAIFLCKPLAL